MQRRRFNAPRGAEPASRPHTPGFVRYSSPLRTGVKRYNTEPYHAPLRALEFKAAFARPSPLYCHHRTALLLCSQLSCNLNVLQYVCPNTDTRRSRETQNILS